MVMVMSLFRTLFMGDSWNTVVDCTGSNLNFSILVNEESDSTCEKGILLLDLPSGSFRYCLQFTCVLNILINGY